MLMAVQLPSLKSAQKNLKSVQKAETLNVGIKSTKKALKMVQAVTALGVY